MKTLREQYRDLNEGQRKKVVWGAVAVAVFLFFFKLPPIIIVRPRPVPVPAVRKPSALAPPLPAKPVPPPVPGAGELKGRWFAESVFPGRASVCSLSMEIKDEKEPGRIAGYSTLRCRPLARPSIVGGTGFLCKFNSGAQWPDGCRRRNTVRRLGRRRDQVSRRAGLCELLGT